MIRIIWKCNFCDDVVVSYSHLRHDMNTCDCGKSSFDLEEGYCRTNGDIERLSTKELIDDTWVKVNTNE